MTPSVADRVAAGAALLDRHQPGWGRLINLDRLDLATGCNCVLGQLWLHREGLTAHPYADAVADLRIEDQVRLGFDALQGGRGTGEYDALTAEWRRVIEARRAQS